jgi:hypothetical protein
MSLAVESLLVDAILAIWRADTAFNTAYPLGRQIRQNKEGQLRGIICRGVSEFPQIWLEAEGGSAARDAPKTFAQQSTSFSSATCDMPIPMEQRIIIRTVSEKFDLDVLTTAEQVWRRLLWQKFPKLGLTWVAGWTDAWARRVQPFPESIAGSNPPPRRFVSTCTMTFALRPFLSQLAS